MVGDLVVSIAIGAAAWTALIRPAQDPLGNLEEDIRDPGADGVSAVQAAAPIAMLTNKIPTI